MKIIESLFYFFIAAILLCSCNATKRAYKAIEKLPPQTNIDSQRLAKRSLATFPVKKDPVTKKGMPIVDRTKDSTKYYKALYNEAVKRPALVKKEIEVKYKDTCTTAISTYEEGYKLGYSIGIYDGKSQCSPLIINTTDTIEVVPQSVQVEIDNYKLQANAAIADNIKTQTKLDSSNKRNLWLLLLLLASALVNVLQFKRII